ncbi:MAG: hypothetical protein GOVbin1573_42 [Prokaryotic dsDNA virus sp.]|nr:MAG: hypothetical protein GOVbin1573_42 [Prokaryotic dsDNA virus sp.]|tara:strand:+ start:141 stop:1385 length:1245 start_codon:yes stop_codon:yes gene_type:complete
MLGALIGGGATLLGGLMASRSQDKATDAATGSALAELNFNKDVWNDQLKLVTDALDLEKAEFKDFKAALEPWRVAGENALSAYNYEMFGGDRPTLTNYDALQERRDILQGDKAFGRLKDSNVFALGNGEFGYGSGPNYGRIEREKRTVTTPGTASQTGPGFYTTADGDYLYSVTVPDGYTAAGGTPATTPQENVFTVGKREFDTKADAEAFIDRRFARNYDGETFDSRREANKALDAATKEARRGALDDAGFEGGVRTEYEGYSRSPQARQLIREGSRAIEGSAAASGGLLSGDTINALSDYRTDVIKADQTDYMNRLLGMSGTGLSTVGMTGSSDPLAGAALGSSVMGAGADRIGSSMSNLGSIQAQGAAAQGNIWQNVFSQLGGIGGYFSGSSPNIFGGGTQTGTPFNPYLY